RGVEDRGRQTGAALADRQWLGGAQRRFRVVAVAKVLGLKRVAARRQGPRRLGRSPHRLGVKQDVGAAVGRQVEVHVARNGEARRTARDRRRVVHRLAQRAARGQVGRGVEDRGRQTGAALADRQWLGGAQRRFRVVAVAKVLGLKR